jgi:Domain of unknown function (DUF4175)
MMQQLDELGDVIHDQQELRDRTFRQGQDQRRRGGERGQQGRNAFYPPMSSHGRSGGALIRPQHRNLISNKNHNCNARPEDPPSRLTLA